MNVLDFTKTSILTLTFASFSTFASAGKTYHVPKPEEIQFEYKGTLKAHGTDLTKWKITAKVDGILWLLSDAVDEDDSTMDFPAHFDENNAPKVKRMSSGNIHSSRSGNNWTLTKNYYFEDKNPFSLSTKLLCSHKGDSTTDTFTCAED